jgi:hypothetical protein
MLFASEVKFKGKSIYEEEFARILNELFKFIEHKGHVE